MQPASRMQICAAVAMVHHWAVNRQSSHCSTKHFTIFPLRQNENKAPNLDIFGVERGNRKLFFCFPTNLISKQSPRSAQMSAMPCAELSYHHAPGSQPPKRRLNSPLEDPSQDIFHDHSHLVPVRQLDSAAFLTV